MTSANRIRQLGKLVTDNSPMILTAIGAAGVLTTAYLTGKATFKAADLIQDNYHQRIANAGGINGDWEPMDVKEKFDLTWKLYIPPASMAAISVAAIIFANRVGSRRTAALATAFTLAEKSVEEYKAKVVEKLGEKKEQGLRDELAQDRIDKNPVSNQQIILTNGGSSLCYEAFTGRYFQSDMETIKTAQNDTNYQILHEDYASLTDFYQRIGLPSNAMSDNVGWNTDKRLELKFSAAISEDKRPCLCIDYIVEPIHHFYRIK